MKAKVSPNGHLLLPAEIRRRDRIIAGQQFEIERLDAGEYLLKCQKVADNEGLVDWLLECPEKDWYRPIQSEFTAS